MRNTKEIKVDVQLKEMRNIKFNDDLFILGALGARGLTLAPLLGDMLAAEILGMPVTLDSDIRRGLDPYRFRLRASRL